MLLAFFLLFLPSVAEHTCSTGGHCASRSMLQKQVASTKSLEAEKAGDSSACGDGEETMDVDCMDTSTMAIPLQQAAATLYMQNQKCTAFIVREPRKNQGALVMTSGVCSVKKVDWYNMVHRRKSDDFIFNYNAQCGHSRKLPENKCQGDLLEYQESGKPRGGGYAHSFLNDYSIYELHKNCDYAKYVKPIKLDVGMPEPLPYTQSGEGIYIIGHPSDQPKKISFAETHGKGNHCALRGNQKEEDWTRHGHVKRSSTRLTYVCDTTGTGSNGSPVISARTGWAIAVHTDGGCKKINSGSWLGNSKEIFQKLDIPFVDRGQRVCVGKLCYPSLFKGYSTQKYRCPKFTKYHRSLRTTFRQCKELCENAFVCVGFAYKGDKHSTKATENHKCVVAYSIEGSLETILDGSPCPKDWAFNKIFRK